MLSRQLTTVPNTSKVRAFTSHTAIVWVPPSSAWGCHRKASDDAFALDEAGDDPSLFGFFDERFQKLEAGSILFRRADSLLHRGELAVENARSGSRLRHL